MKKELTKKKLSLAKETLRRLTDRDLAQVQGGTIGAVSATSCIPGTCDSASGRMGG